MYKLMIVDDSTVIRKRIEKSFQSTSIEIVAMASDGVQAIELFKQHQPDIITMDITMPNMDGLECIQTIMQMGTSVSILVISALSDKSTGLKALSYGARGFICKPFSEEQLVTALRKIIQAKKQPPITKLPK